MLAFSKIKCSKTLAFPVIHYEVYKSAMQSVELFCAYVILVIGAVNHPNMGWSKKEHDDSKYITRVTAFIEFASIMVFSYLKFEDSYILYMSFGLILSAVLMLMGKVLGQEVKES